MDTTLLTDGLVLLVLGMGMVFVFLTIMVGLISVSARVLSRFEHLLPPETPPSSPGARRGPAGDDQDLIAVLTAAVRRYQNEHSVNQ